MAYSKRCKWISFSLLSLTVVLILLLFYTLQTKRVRCPNEGELMDEESSQCFARNSREPCNNNLVFAELEPRSPFGSCSCPYMFTNRVMLYHDGECYYIFSRAFCAEDEWLNITATGAPSCEKNPCLEFSTTSTSTSENDGHEWVPIRNGHCAILGETREGCPDGAVVRFHRYYVLPSCHNPPANSGGPTLGAIGVPSYTRCPSGSYRSITGRCQPAFDFDF